MNAPKIIMVRSLRGNKLLIEFENGVKRIYDCTPILCMDRFSLLRNEAFFRKVKVDPGGYGISWNDDMDLSEYELWTNGIEVAESAIIST